MNEVLNKTMLRDKIYSVFLAGLALTLLLGIFFWCYTVLKTIYVVDELADQNLYNKEVILSQTATNNQDRENLSQPGEIAAPQAHSGRVEKSFLSVDTVSEVGAKPTIYNPKISKQIPFSGEQFQPVSEQAADKKELQIAATANHIVNNSAENSSTAKISTFYGNTSENYRSDRAADLYQRITENQKQTKEENVGQTVATKSNDPVEIQAEPSMNSVADQNEKDKYAQVVRLQLEIERLTERIETGLSDRDYYFYTHLKSPVFVLHDKERLEFYQTELDKMLLDMTHQ